MPIPQPIILLLSGGMDSVALLYDLHSQGNPLHCLLFSYGQKNCRELDFAREHCQSLKVPFTVIELHRIKGLFARSSITDGEGSKIVPNRNAVFLNIAASIAAVQNTQLVAIGCNYDDRADFPDCRPEFFDAINACLKASGTDVEICAPYRGMTKRQIVVHAKKNGWPVESSCSCYNGNDCGECDACKLRKDALQ